jgi:hypothetical protein
MNILEKLRDNNKAFKIGIFLLIINPPLGYLGFIVGGYCCTVFEDKAYLTAATLFYAFTWVMAGAGIVLAGTSGLEIAQNYLKKIVKKKHRNSQ